MTQTSTPPLGTYNSRPRCVIVGAGYAGLPLATRMSQLLGSKGQVTLINPEPKQELTCDLYRSLRNGKSYTLPFVDILKANDVSFVEGRLVEIDKENKNVKLSSMTSQSLSYDKLILCSGLQGTVPQIAGFEEIIQANKESLQKSIFSFKKSSEVHALKMALTRIGWGADYKGKEDLFVTVLGAGSTGLEVAGELAHLRKKNRRCRVILVDASKKLISDFSPLARKLLKRKLRKLGIETILGAPASLIKQHELHLNSGQVIPWNLLVTCTGGSNSPRWSHAIQDNQAPRGLYVDQDFGVSGCSHIYAAGDLAYYRHHTGPLSPSDPVLPPRAQFASQSAKYIAQTVAHSLHIDPPEDNVIAEAFQPRDLGYLISLGPQDGIGRIGPQAHSTVGKLSSPFIQGSKVDKMKKAVRLKYLLEARAYKEAYKFFR